MASPNSSWTEILTTTLDHRSKVLADDMSNNSAILTAMKESGGMKTFPGGVTIVEEIMYQENSTYKRYSGYETLNISPSDVITAFSFGIKQAAIAISISGLEELQNAGPEQMIDLFDARLENAELTFINNHVADMYSTGSADSSKQIGGLQLLVADDPTTGTVGGISRVSYTFARNQKYSGVTDGGASVDQSNILQYMTALWVLCTRNKEKPDVILADNNYWTFYHNSLTAIQRISNERDNAVARAGFQTIMYMGVPVVLDGGHGGSCPANHMYFLNTKYIRYRPHAKRNIVPLKPDRYSVNQDAMVRLLAWAGNMTLRNAFLQGVLIA